MYFKDLPAICNFSCLRIHRLTQMHASLPYVFHHHFEGLLCDGRSMLLLMPHDFLHHKQLHVVFLLSLLGMFALISIQGN